VKRFGKYLLESGCSCPDGWSVLASFDNWCLCIEDEPDEDDDDTDCGCLGEGAAPSDTIRKALEFTLANYCDVVRVKLATEGMFVRIGGSKYFPIPESEQPHVWEVIESRLMQKSM
jgi:hypothetical protein